MELETIQWVYQLACAFPNLVPVTLLVFRAQVDLLIWSQVNVDAAHPSQSFIRDTLGIVLSFPMAYCPSWLAGSWNRPLKNAAFLQMALNALFWEAFLSCFLDRQVTCVLWNVDRLSEVYWPDRSLLEFLILGK